MLKFFQWLKEAHQHHVEKLGKYNKTNPKDLNMSSIFGDKRRIAINLDGTEDPIYQFMRLFKTITNHPLTLEEIKKGIISIPIQTQQGTKNRTLTIGNFLKRNNRTDLMDMWSQIKDRINNINEKESYSIIISREPIDLLRMSDHVHPNGQEIQSCHSTSKGWFHCAVKEAKVGGAIAYAVKTSDLNKINLQDKEIFADTDRKKEGIIPLERLRLRRFTNDNQEIIIPELRSYSATHPDTYEQTRVPGFKEAVTKWAKEVQQATIEEIKKNPSAFSQFKLRGGSYQDNNAGELWSHFFSGDFKGKKHSIDQTDVEEKEEFIDAARWMQIADGFYQNHEENWQNYDFITVKYQAHDAEFDNGQAHGTWSAKISWIFTNEDFPKKPTEGRNIISGLADFLTQRRHRTPEISYNIDSDSDGGFDVTISTKIVSNRYNDGSLGDFEGFLDDIDHLDQNYEKIKDDMRAFFASKRLMNNKIIDHHDDLNLSHFHIELNHNTGAHYYVQSKPVNIGNIIHYPNDARLLNIAGVRLLFPWNIFNELNIPAPTHGAIPDRQVFFMLDGSINLYGFREKKLPFPNAPVEMKFAFELNLHDIYYKLVYEKIKDLDSHFDKIVEDMREWWGKMVIVMSEYQKKLEKRSFDID